MREIICPECGSSVAYGRLSCSSCGALLASVVGAARRPRPSIARSAVDPGETYPAGVEAAEVDETADETVDEAADERDEMADEPAGRSDAAAARGVPASLAPDESEPALASAEASPAEAEVQSSVDGSDGPERSTAPSAEPGAPAAEMAMLAAPADPDPAPARSEAATPPPARTGPPPILREWHGPPPTSYQPAALGTEPPDIVTPQPVAEAVDAAPQIAATEARVPPVTSPAAARPAPPAVPSASPAAGPVELAGAYLPPSAVLRPSAGVGDAAAETGSRSGPVVPGGITTARRPFGTSLLATPAQPPDPAKAAANPGQASLLADLPIESPTDTPAWLVLAGSVAGAVSFLLPWASSSGQVIGGGTGNGYFDTWGLATASDVVLFLLALAVLVLTVVPTRSSAVVRGGILPLVLSGALLATGWLYIGLPYGYGPGIPVLVAGGILLLVGGILAIRHAATPPPVQ